MQFSLHSAVSEEEQERGIKEKFRNPSVVLLRKKVPSWLLRCGVNYSHHTAGTSVWRTLLIVILWTSKVQSVQQIQIAVLKSAKSQPLGLAS